jgi:hypothetical protein
MNQIKKKMANLDENSAKYKKYQKLLEQYDSAVNQGKGMTDAGTVLMAGMNRADKMQWNWSYRNTSWEDLTTDEMASKEKAITKDLVESIDDLGGDKKAINKYLDKTHLAELTGTSKEEWARQFREAGTDNKRLTTLVEQIMTELNKKNNDPTKGTGATNTPGQNPDSTMNANQVIIYAGSTVNNSNARNDGGDSSSIFGGVTTSGNQRKNFWK